MIAAFVNINQRRKVYKVRRDSKPEDYKTLFQFNKENVEWLTDHFLGQNYETRGRALTNDQRMRIFLRYLSDPGFQSGVAEDIGVNQSTISNTFSVVLEKILRRAHLRIKFPSTLAQMEVAMNEWNERCTFPHAVGVIDYSCSN